MPGLSKAVKKLSESVPVNKFPFTSVFTETKGLPHRIQFGAVYTCRLGQCLGVGGALYDKRTTHFTLRLLLISVYTMVCSSTYSSREDRNRSFSSVGWCDLLPSQATYSRQFGFRNSQGGTSQVTYAWTVGAWML